MNTYKYQGLPANLLTKGLREQLSHRTEQQFHSSMAAIERMGSMLAALGEIRNNPSYTTKEIQAREYGNAFKQAIDKAGSAHRESVRYLDELESEWKLNAEKRAGLHDVVPQETMREIRTALRGMTEKERNKALEGAAKRGEMHVLQSVRGVTPVLTGKIDNGMLNLYVADVVKAANPAIETDLEDLDFMRNKVNFAADSFRREASKMRDPILEEKGAAQEKSAAAALRVINSSGEAAA